MHTTASAPRFAAAILAAGVIPADPNAPTLQQSVYAHPADGSAPILIAQTTGDYAPHAAERASRYLASHGFTALQLIATCDGSLIWDEVTPL